MMNPSVGVVIVTYGDRWSLLSNVLKRIINQKFIKEILLIDNASKYDLETKINQAFNINNKISVITFEENKGSAYGVKYGIQAIIKKGNCDLIWLLDDDNYPEEGSLDILLQHYNELIREYEPNEFALVSLRNDRQEYINTAVNGTSKGSFPVSNSFIGVHFKKIFFHLFKRTERKLVTQKFKEFNKERIEIPVAPYGGLLFHKSLINKIGLPNEQYFLYSDDHEFIHRLVKKGGRIYLIPRSIVRDLESSWNNKEKKHMFYSFLNEESNFRVYYTIRNRVNFETNNLTNNHLLYKINKFLFITILFIFSLKYKKRERFMLILKAIKDGEKNQLGIVKL